MISEKKNWKTKFTSLLFPIDPDEIKFQEASELKYNNFPSSLYKFKSFDKNGHSVSILENDRIMLSPASKFNDVHDSSIRIDSETLMNARLRKRTEIIVNKLSILHQFTPDEIDQLKNSERFFYDVAVLVQEEEEPFNNEMTVEEVAKTLEEIFNKQLEPGASNFSEGNQEGMYVTCFSEEVTSNRMWGYYASSHEGFCIEYELKQVDSILAIIKRFYPVIYTNEVFDATPYLLNALNTGKYNNLVGVYASIVKSEDWAHEKEWRYVCPFGPSEEPVFIQVPKPKSVYLGAKVSKKNKNKILEIAKKRGFEVYEMRKNPSKFDLEYGKIYDPK